MLCRLVVETETKIMIMLSVLGIINPFDAWRRKAAQSSGLSLDFLLLVLFTPLLVHNQLLLLGGHAGYRRVPIKHLGTFSTCWLIHTEG